MPTQVKPRGGNNGTVMGRTLTSRELDMNTSKNRIHMHDGSTPGGWGMVNTADVQNDAVSYASATGTNSLTVTLDPVPVALVAGMRIRIKMQNTNTSAMSIDLNSLGAVSTRLRDSDSATLVAMSGGECIQAGIYDFAYDGTYWQLMSDGSSGLATISQSDLETLIGSVSFTTSVANDTQDLTLPGGEYGFYPQIKASGPAFDFSAYIGDTITNNNTWLTSITLKHGSVGGLLVMYAQQRYVSASPPFDMGDGEATGFMFLLMNKDGTVSATYNADVPPWAYNGPTDIKASRIDPLTGQKFRRYAKRPTPAQMMDGAEITWHEEAITQKVKNADMRLIPHPFQKIGAGQTVIMLDPMDKRVRRMMEYQNAGGDIAEFLRMLKPDNEQLKRKGPRGVRAVTFKV